jgi:hypothetical protein
MFVSTNYHGHVRPLTHKMRVEKTVKTLLRFRAQNESLLRGSLHIVGCGISGQAISWPVSYMTEIPMCVVRKKGEKHHGYEIEGHGPLTNYVIIDDLISSGTTIHWLIDSLEEEHKRQIRRSVEGEVPAPVCRGIILYNSDWRCDPQYGVGRKDALFNRHSGVIPIMESHWENWQ